ncbi:MAG: endonuclease III [Bacilli bacterium]|nr:endonuclease III [Bacilli bacterium]
MKINKEFYKKLDIMIPDPKCSLNYTKDYELLIATVLSAQCTDERVNQVTPILWSKYDIYSLAKANSKDVADIIRPLGNMNKRSEYIITIAKRLVEDFNGKVPNDRDYLESLPGVGRKTTNVVLANIYNENLIAVDTHVSRVAKRLGLAKETDTPDVIEQKLMKAFDNNELLKMHHQLLLFGRYICTARNPKCEECLLKDICKYKASK